MSVIVLAATNDRHDLAFYNIDDAQWVTIRFDRDAHEFEPSANGEADPFVTGIDETDPEAWEQKVRTEADRKGVVLGTFFPSEPDPTSAWNQEGWYFSIERVKVMP